MVRLLQALIDRIQKTIYWTVIFFVTTVFGIDIPKHLSNPGTGFGKWFVSKVFKNNSPATNELLKSLKFPENGKVVEVGFGLGESMKTALSMSPASTRFYGYEVSASMLSEASKTLKGQSRVELSLKDCATEGLPFPDSSLDVVYHANVLYFVPDAFKFLKDTCRALKSGGMLGMNIVQPTELGPQMPDSPFKNLYTEPEIIALCKQAGFQQVTVSPFVDAMERMLVVAIK